MAWRFDGTLLPGGDSGHLVVGAGPVERLPGSFALPGVVDAHCHLTVAIDQQGRTSMALGEPNLAAFRVKIPVTGRP
jgi:imidazolonepropionase-like amidohydrolase